MAAASGRQDGAAPPPPRRAAQAAGEGSCAAPWGSPAASQWRPYCALPTLAVEPSSALDKGDGILRRQRALGRGSKPPPPQPGSVQRPPPPQGSSSADLQVVAAAAGGSAQQVAQLMELLRQRRCLRLLDAALAALPASALPQLLGLLHEGGGWPRPEMATAMLVLDRLQQAGLRHEVDAAMQRLLDSGLQPHYRLFLAWASQHAQAGSVQGVRHVMQLVREAAADRKASPHYYLQLIRAYCTRGRWQDAEQVLGEMRGQGVPPNDHVYRAIIWCCGHHQRADRAARLFEEMVEKGLEPSMVTWSALLNAYADSKQPFRAAEALVAMRKHGIKPSVQVYGALAKAFARGGDWRRAHDVLQVMQHDGVQPNEQVFGSIIEAAAVAGKPAVAAELLRRMRTAGIQPNVVAYTSLLSSYGATGDVEAAEAVLQEMTAAGCRPNARTYTELMSQLAAKGRYEDCEKYFNAMIAAGWPADKVSYAILIDSVLHRWAADRQPRLLALAQARWEEAAGAGGALRPHTYLHQPQGRLSLDLHGYSAWTAQLAVLSSLDRLLAAHAAGGGSHLTRLEVITGRGNRRRGRERRHHSVLRELVVEMLQHLVPVYFGKANDGMLVLHARDLRRLFDSMRAEGKTFSLDAVQHCLVDPLSL